VRIQQIILCCYCSRGFFVALAATFLQKHQNEGTSKLLQSLGLEDSLALNFAATFFADLSVSSTQAAAALADFLVIQPRIDIHGSEHQKSSHLMGRL